MLVSNLQEIKKIVESNNIGFVLKSYTIEALYNAIISYNFCHINRSTIKEIALQKYNWEAQETVMLKKYRELLYIKTYF